MYSQMEPMKQLAGQLKRDKDSANKKILSVESEMGQLIEKMKVCFIVVFSSLYSLDAYMSILSMYFLKRQDIQNQVTFFSAT